jgi:hypothetical protein
MKNPQGSNEEKPTLGRAKMKNLGQRKSAFRTETKG